MFIKNKKGGVDWFVVTIIIAILTLVVFVLIAVFFPFSEVIDRAACKESVVLRATLPGNVIDAKQVISLRCKTQKICVTTKSSGKGTCTNLGKDFDTMRLTGSTVALKQEQIKMFLSREMADCWEMFGEGKLQIFSRDFEATGFISRGIICDKIEFDNTILEGKEPIIAVNGLIEYMATHKVPNQNFSYMDYLRNTPEGDSAAKLYGSFLNTGVDNKEKYSKNTDIYSLKGVKSIVYIESTLTNFLQNIGGGIGAGAGLIGAFYTPKFMAKFLIGTGAVLGGSGGNAIQKWWYSDTFCTVKDNIKDCKDYVGGLVLTDYTPEGFSKWSIESFENIN